MADGGNSYVCALWQDEEIPRANLPMPRVSDYFCVCVRVGNGAEVRECIFSITRAAFLAEEEMRAFLSAAFLRLDAGLPAYFQKLVMEGVLDFGREIVSDPQNASPKVLPLAVEILVPDFYDLTFEDIEIIGDHYNYVVWEDDGVWQEEDVTASSAGEGPDCFPVQLRICNGVELRESKFLTTRDTCALELDLSAAFIRMGARLSLPFQDSIIADILDFAGDPQSATEKVLAVAVEVIIPEFEDASNMYMDMDESFQDSQINTVPATKSSIQALEKVTAVDSSLEGECVVCLQELVCAGQEIARMPCEHIMLELNMDAYVGQWWSYVFGEDLAGDVFYANWDEVLPEAIAMVSTLGGFGSEEQMQRINGEANVVTVNATKEYGKRFAVGIKRAKKEIITAYDRTVHSAMTMPQQQSKNSWYPQIDLNYSCKRDNWSSELPPSLTLLRGIWGTTVPHKNES
ncbi:hypothetical protein RJ639_029334 [Escallonia herrerae]|uniref:Uncharacterized protein n=1 Tax=Escallonia herrerae TaxID=1293975 RepID=A0AA89BCT2_9ASTE|nr:hypothetical protein RJ639_029334 [Escallonia herrerae]